MKKVVIVYELVDLDSDRIMIGTIEDVRTSIKNRWIEDKDFISEMTGIEIEEDFYTYVDEDSNLNNFITDMGYKLMPVCEVPIEDFM